MVKDGYRDYEKTVEVKPGRSLEVTASLEKIETQPEGLWKDSVTGMEFVYVKGGCYQMGDTFGDGQDNEKRVVFRAAQGSNIAGSLKGGARSYLWISFPSFLSSLYVPIKSLRLLS